MRPNQSIDLCARCGNYRKNHPDNLKSCQYFILGQECVDDPLGEAKSRVWRSTFAWEKFANKRKCELG